MKAYWLPWLFLIAACASSGPVLRGVVGTWYSGRADGSGGFALETCQYTAQGAFSCAVEEKGCSGRICEVQSYNYSGTWLFQEQRLTRHVVGEAPQPEMELSEASRDHLVFIGGQHWYRSKSARDAQVLGAP
jgi:hypothetical protein